MAMANSFQRLTFAFSSLSPILLVFSIIYFGKGGTLHIFLCGLILSFLLFFVGGICFLRISKKKVQSLDYKNQVSTIEPDSQGLSTLIGAYSIPLLSLFAESSNFELFVAIVIILALILFLSDCIPPAIFLLICGYRFYVVSLKSGMSGVHLISKRKRFTSASSVKKVKWLFENDYWLLDMGE